MKLWTGGAAPYEITALCEPHSALVSVQPVPVDPPPAVPPPTPAIDARGFGAHLIVQLAADSWTNDPQVSFGCDPGTYRLRLGWTVFVAGGTGGFEIQHLFWNEPLPYTQEFWLTVLATGAEQLVIPRFLNSSRRAPYTHLPVLRGAVLDEFGVAVPTNVELTLSQNYWIPARTIYQLGLRI